MATNTAQILNPSIFIQPSQKFKNYISNLKVSGDIPHGISNFIFKKKIKAAVENVTDIHYLITEEDRNFIKSINVESKEDIFTKLPLKSSSVSTSDKLLSLFDLHWLYRYIQKENMNKDDKIYLHELIEGSHIILPKNQEIPRNEELEKRCQRLKAQQENKSYHRMTKNVDSTKRKLPEDSFGYHVKQMNRHLVAIFQFIVSVAAGFAFGFIGVELIIGSLDFGFRLLLGIICALTIALAELYFLAKKLNEDIQMEYIIENQFKSKVD
ncbi:transmembrane protein 199 [Anoplophora glabripennis]|uniref:transmembrane protein 199 n=1 Tax=Anoplophora glabripennis TaxID=217634 RepID=UPI000873C201|nr:transmembrane protein 199 [Anoplophora glabripennis]